jgi:hypothetical protein
VFENWNGVADRGRADVISPLEKARRKIAAAGTSTTAVRRAGDAEYPGDHVHDVGPVPPGTNSGAGDAWEPPAEPATAPRVSRPAAQPATPIVKFRLASQIDPKPVSWLWPGRVPFGMLTILDGDPSNGKSTITADWAARVSRGWAMPGCDAPACEAAGVMFLAAEDSAEHTIRPRLDVAGADLARCLLVDGIDVGDRERAIVLPDDLPYLEALMTEHGVKLLVVDPILGFLCRDVDSASDQSSREVLHELKRVAERTGAAVVALRHLNKKGTGPAMYRGGGSIAFSAAARSVLTVGRHPDDPTARVLASTKCNLAPTPRAVEYRLESDPDGLTWVARVWWGAELDCDADALVSAAERPADREEQKRAAASKNLDLENDAVLLAIDAEAAAGRPPATANKIKNGHCPQYSGAKLRDILDRLTEAGRIEAVEVTAPVGRGAKRATFGYRRRIIGTIGTAVRPDDLFPVGRSSGRDAGPL